MHTPCPHTLRSAQLVSQWRDELSALLGRPASDIARRGLHTSDFAPYTVRLELADGSRVEFRYSFVCMDDHTQSIAVFSEHGGHHQFSWHDTRVWIDDALMFEDGDAV